MVYTDKEIGIIIKKYFETESYPHALLLTGEWGIGKTYFIQNHFFNAPQKEINGKKLVYTSLYGLTSVQELKEQIYDDIISANLGKNTWSVASSIGGFVSGMLFKTIGVDDINDIKDAKNKLRDWIISPKDYIFIIDDIERTEIPVKAWMGVIAQLLEKYKTKVLLIGNDKKILDGPNSGIYKTEKEKIIAYTLPYQVNLTDKIDGITKREIYREFSKYKEIIEEVMNQWECVNLRYIEFAGNIFNLILGEFSNISDKSLKTIPDLENILVKNIMNVSIAYQKGIDRREADSEDTQYFVLQNYYTKGKSANNQFLTFKFVEDYVYDAYVNPDDIEKGLKEFQKSLQNTEENKRLREKKKNDAINKLLNFENYNDDKVRQLFTKMKDNLKNGEYSLSDYRNIFIITVDLQKIGFQEADRECIVRIMKDNILYKRYVERSISENIRYFSNNLTGWNEIQSFIKEQQESKSQLDINSLFGSNTEVKDIIDTLLKLREAGKRHLLADINVNILDSYIMNLSNNKINEFRKGIQKIYAAENIQDFYRDDAKNILSLKNLLEKRKFTADEKIKKYNIEELRKLLGKIYHKLIQVY